MSLNPATMPSDDAPPPSRPKLIDYAIYAIIVRCVASMGGALALFGARSDVSRPLAKTHPEWSAATLDHNVSTAIKGNAVFTLLILAMVLVMAKFIREGRNWARWMYLAFTFLIARDAFQILGLTAYHNLVVKALAALTSIASLTALVMMFLPATNSFFKRRSGTASLMGGMFRPKAGGAASPARTRAPIANPAAVDAPVADPVSGPVAGTAPRRPPRAKSRRQPTE